MMNIENMIRNLTSDFVSAGIHYTQHAYEVIGLPKIGILSHCKPPTTERAHFLINLNGETADLKTQIIDYRQDQMNPDNIVAYGVLTSVKNADQLTTDTSLFKRGTPIQIYCDHAMTAGVLKFTSSIPEPATPAMVTLS